MILYLRHFNDQPWRGVEIVYKLFIYNLYIIQFIYEIDNVYIVDRNMYSARVCYCAVNQYLLGIVYVV